MVSSFAFSLFMGTALGFLSGLGTGGGSLLILWLTLVLGMEAGEARVMNLMFFIPSAVIACIFRRKQGRLDIKKVLPAILAGSISAGVCAILGSRMDTSLLRKLFGGLLLLTGIREIRYKPKKP
ncbi:MAG: TSUP family transporter [Oscillospiraceae bacterium]|nr:TSUP family transporter [Oscillospiraceae bacterium]